MKILELIEQLKAMPEKMEGFNTEGELVILNTHKLADALQTKPDGEVLLRSMKCIEQWARLAVNHLPPFGNNYRSALVSILKESQCAIDKEGEVIK